MSSSASIRDSGPAENVNNSWVTSYGKTQKPYLVTHQLVNLNRSMEDEQQYYYQLLKSLLPLPSYLVQW